MLAGARANRCGVPSGGTHPAVAVESRGRQRSAAEDQAWWESELGVPLEPGIFGQNLTTVGVDVTHAVIGEPGGSAPRWSRSPNPAPRAGSLACEWATVSSRGVSPPPGGMARTPACFKKA